MTPARLRALVYIVLSGLSVSLASAQPDAKTPWSFDAYIQSAYRTRSSLPGVVNTASAIEQSLTERMGKPLSRRSVLDGNVQALKSFLSSLPGDDRPGWSVVYLAGHQSAAGELEFVSAEKIRWDLLLEGVEIKSNSRRITLLDVCYADAAHLVSGFSAKMGPVVVFSSDAAEKTYELELGTRRPVDYARRYPEAFQWFSAHMDPGWDKTVTFFGLMWVQEIRKQPLCPATKADWDALLSGLKKAAEDFRKNRSEKLASTIIVREQ